MASLRGRLVYSQRRCQPRLPLDAVAIIRGNGPIGAFARTLSLFQKKIAADSIFERDRNLPRRRNKLPRLGARSLVAMKIAAAFMFKRDRNIPKKGILGTDTNPCSRL